MNHKELSKTDGTRIQHYCNLELISSNVDCLVKPLSNKGYLILSSGSTSITDISDNISVFNNQVSHSCDGKVSAVVLKKNDQNSRAVDEATS